MPFFLLDALRLEVRIKPYFIDSGRMLQAGFLFIKVLQITREIYYTHIQLVWSQLTNDRRKSLDFKVCIYEKLPNCGSAFVLQAMTSGHLPSSFCQSSLHSWTICTVLLLTAFFR